jgi:hypothetical protein
VSPWRVHFSCSNTSSMGMFSCRHKTQAEQPLIRLEDDLACKGSAGSRCGSATAENTQLKQLSAATQYSTVASSMPWAPSVSLYQTNLRSGGTWKGPSPAASTGDGDVGPMIGRRTTVRSGSDGPGPGQNRVSWPVRVLRPHGAGVRTLSRPRKLPRDACRGGTCGGRKTIIVLR